MNADEHRCTQIFQNHLRPSVFIGVHLRNNAMRKSIILVSSIVMLTTLARAAPPPDANPDWAPWFQSLERPDVGGSCCSIADCRRVQSRLGTVGYEVLMDDRWVLVPGKRIVQGRENPTGEAVVCARGHVIICFVPAPEG